MSVDTLQALIDFLQTNMGVKMFKHAFRENMMYKVERYTELQAEAEEEVEREVHLIQLKTSQLKQLAGVQGNQDNWHIFDTLSGRYKDSKDRAVVFEALKARAKGRLRGDMMHPDVRANDPILPLRDDLVLSLRSLSQFRSQGHIVSRTINIIGAFIKNPRLFRTNMINYMLLGGSGTGKTVLASAIGEVFAKAGMFVGNRLLVTGRGDFVGQYEGQTVSKTRNFLLSHLDNGVIFVDEAYSLTPWQNGSPETYGSEAIATMLDFMTRYIGLYFVIVAGYETQMTRYFLAANEGLSRRFPNKFVLNDLSPSELVRVFQTSIARAQGLKDVTVSRSYFTEEAWQYLESLINTCTRGETTLEEEFDPTTKRSYKNIVYFKPNFEFMYTIFQNQAGSMVNLAEDAVATLLEKITYEEAISFRRTKDTDGTGILSVLPPQGKDVMRDVVTSNIEKTSLSHSDLYLTQLEQVESII